RKNKEGPHGAALLDLGQYAGLHQPPLRQLEGRYLGSTVLEWQCQAMLPPLVLGESTNVLPLIAVLTWLPPNVAVIRPVLAAVTWVTYLPLMLTALAKPAEALVLGNLPVLL